MGDTSQAKVFVPHAEAAWAAASVLRVLENRKFEVRIDALEDGPDEKRVAGEVIVVDARAFGEAGLPLQNDEGAVADMSTLNNLHEPGILFNLRRRFFSALPYTYTGDMCIAVNPYRWLKALYEPAVGTQYCRVRTTADRSELPPHAYATSALAYAGLSDRGQNQSILVSGESGAGKTETVKILLGHLAQMAGGLASGEGSESVTITKIVQSNPLLESFGNAKTVRNDNSSRFGKFTQLQFDGQRGAPLMSGSICTTYLLEKSRVVGHTAGERSYHVFYQLMAAPEESKAEHGVAGKNAEDFRYLTADREEASCVIEGKTDAERYAMTRQALAMIGISEDEIRFLFRALAGVLYLGQLDFAAASGDEDASEVVDKSLLEPAAELLGICGGADALGQALCFRVIRARNESVVGNNNPVQAAGVRDAAAKALYACLFDWLVGRINASTARPVAAGNDGGTVALLDIFGFESFAVNRFEQLCINYANEKLQQKFCTDVFKTVQTEYEKEGIPWSHIDFADNAEVLSLIESRMGVIAVLNEECLRPKGSDESFTNKLATLHADHPSFAKAKLSGRTEFGIRHYAGIVSYTADGFCEKNKDSIGDDVASLLRSSENPLLPAASAVSAAAAANAAGGGGPVATAAALASVAAGGKENNYHHAHTGGHHSHKRNTSALSSNTLAAQFRTNLSVLMETIERTQVQYVRCIKPNAVKSPSRLDNAKVAEQLRCAGVIEAIRVSRAAYPNRLGHAEFCWRFGLLSQLQLQPAKNGKRSNGGPSEPATPAESDSSDDEQDTVDRAGRSKSKALLRELLGAGAGAAGGYEMGRTRVYFRAGVLEGLEQRRLARQAAMVTRLQAVVRMWQAEAGLRAARAAATAIVAAERRRSATVAYLRLRRGAMAAQSEWRRVLATRKVEIARRERASSRAAAAWRGSRQMRWYLRLRAASVAVQAVVRGRQARVRAAAAKAEAEEAAKLENQIVALQRRLQEEQVARRKMEEAHQRLLEAKGGDSDATLVAAATVGPPEGSAAAFHAERLQLSEENGGNGVGGSSPRTAALEFFSEERERQRGTVDFMGESAQVIDALQAEVARLRKDNGRLKEEGEELRREKQRLANSYEASGMSYHALHSTIKKLASANKKIGDEYERTKEQRDVAMGHVGKLALELQNRDEEQRTLRLLYESEVTTRKKQLRVMEAMVRLVGETPPVQSPEEQEEMTQLMAAMYRECLNDDPNVVASVDSLSKGINRAAEKTSSMLSSAKASFGAFFRAR